MSPTVAVSTQIRFVLIEGKQALYLLMNTHCLVPMQAHSHTAWEWGWGLDLEPTEKQLGRFEAILE